jgi:gluconolactonase
MGETQPGIGTTKMNGRLPIPEGGLVVFVIQRKVLALGLALVAGTPGAGCSDGGGAGAGAAPAGPDVDAGAAGGPSGRPGTTLDAEGGSATSRGASDGGLGGSAGAATGAAATGGAGDASSGAGGAAAADARPADAGSARDGAPPAVGASPLAGAGALELVAGGFKKLDTPCWLAKEGVLVFTDLDAGKQLKLTPPRTVEVLRDGGRCTAGADGALYFAGTGGLQRSQGLGAPEPLADKLPDGSPVSVNDLAISRKGLLYLSNLKAPDPPGRGGLNVLGVAAKTISIVWDGRVEMGLWNPNGVALSPDEKVLYVGISSYDNRATSAVYRFPIRDDGSVDVQAGKAQKWAAVSAPDGIAVDQMGNVYFTAGGVIEVWSAEGKRWGTLKVPRGSATNLGFGGADMRTLYVTTNPELYQVKLGVPGLP